MNRIVKYCLLVAIMTVAGLEAAVAGTGRDVDGSEQQSPLVSSTRFLFNTNSTLIPITSSGTLIGSTVVILGLGALLILLIVFLANASAKNGAYGGTSPFANLFGLANANNYQQQTYTYEPYSKQANQPASASVYQSRSSEDFDNETYGIINSISKMEDFWRQFDIKDLQCQKRALCEINHNESLLSSIPTKFLTTFSYVRYLSLLNLPDSLKKTMQGYQEAVDHGKAHHDCALLYRSCGQLSLKDTLTKYNDNTVDQ